MDVGDFVVNQETFDIRAVNSYVLASNRDRRYLKRKRRIRQPLTTADATLRKYVMW